MTRSLGSLEFGLSCLLALAACGGDDGKTGVGSVQPDAGGALGADASTDDSDDSDDDEAPVPCGSDYPEYAVGRTATAGTVTVKTVSATPAPPLQQTPNTWVVALLNADGTPNTDASISAAQSYMPVHRHYGLTTPVVTKLSTPGQWQIDTINFRMTGPWQVSVNVQPGAGIDAGTGVLGTFPVCVH